MLSLQGASLATSTVSSETNIDFIPNVSHDMHSFVPENILPVPTTILNMSMQLPSSCFFFPSEVLAHTYM